MVTGPRDSVARADLLPGAGLIHAALRGRERVYELDAGRLRTLTRGWLDRFDAR